jgi:hypothetical protein
MLSLLNTQKKGYDDGELRHSRNAHASVPGASQSPSAWRRRPDPEAKRATETATATPGDEESWTHGWQWQVVVEKPMTPLPSGKHTKNYGKSPFLSMFNGKIRYFYGHFQ